MAYTVRTDDGLTKWWFTGTGTAGKVRVFALVVDMDAPRTADEVDRDTLA